MQDYERLYERAKAENLMPLFASLCPEPKRSELMDLSDFEAALTGCGFREPLCEEMLEAWKPKITDYSTGLRLLKTYANRPNVLWSVYERLLEILDDPSELLDLSKLVPFELKEKIILKLLKINSPEGANWVRLSDVCRSEWELWAEVADFLESNCPTIGHAIALFRLGNERQKTKAEQALEKLNAGFSAWWEACLWEKVLPFDRLFDLAETVADYRLLAEKSTGQERLNVLNKIVQHLQTTEDGCWLYRQVDSGSPISTAAITFLRLQPNTAGKWQAVLQVAREGSSFRQEAIERLQVLSTTFADWRWLYEQEPNLRSELLRRLIATAETYSDLQWVYERCSRNRLLSEQVLEQLVSLASTKEECLYVWERLPIDSQTAKNLAFRCLTS
jgi:hypothetical protein